MSGSRLFSVTALGLAKCLSNALDQTHFRGARYTAMKGTRRDKRQISLFRASLHPSIYGCESRANRESSLQKTRIYPSSYGNERASPRLFRALLIPEGIFTDIHMEICNAILFPADPTQTVSLEPARAQFSRNCRARVLFPPRR